MNRLLKESVRNQRRMISVLLQEAMSKLAFICIDKLNHRDELEKALEIAFIALPYCKFLYAMDPNSVQICSNITREGLDNSQYGRDRSGRPYMLSYNRDEDFHLSEAYISIYEQRPSLTAIQAVRHPETGELLALLGSDYDLRELPHTESLYAETPEWKQIKGDPAIRGNLFMQQRVQSHMDEHFAEVLSLLQELMEEHGVFHGQLHFSGSRATVWHVNDPYRYRLLDYEELTDPDTCLAYPRCEYFDQAIVPRKDIPRIFDRFRLLRFADETVYLRSGSLNIVNGVVGLNFSCDGTHYMPFEEFLSKDESFWFGTTSPGSGATCNTPDQSAIDDLVEIICLRGCTTVTEIIRQMQLGQPIDGTESLTAPQHKQLLKELQSVMTIYEQQE